MKPAIQNISFGSIKIDDETFDHDVLIRLDGKIEKRRKKLSKAIYGTSHIISLEEAEYVYENGLKNLVIGSGMFDRCRLSDEARDYFERMGCEVHLLSSKKFVAFWNTMQTEGAALIHITC